MISIICNIKYKLFLDITISQNNNIDIGIDIKYKNNIISLFFINLDFINKINVKRFKLKLK